MLDKNPKLAAKFQCDKHICKMIVESCQILCSVFYYNSEIKPPYKLTHKNHPCCVWARESLGNFKWLLKHTEYLLDEYSLRYAKRHKCNDVFCWIKSNMNVLKFNKTELTDFVQAMPEHYRLNDAVKAYRNYYKGEKAEIAVWKNSVIPDWFA
ncbi:MAG: pyrimidine dimer DNA glycosylase/endonuclease V [Endomicrobiaceae bacterium]|nr:pyrimidine dimer DNA glycosylase/endonuclease V [Endomicrobiaceae bacterium]MDD3730672.1 pyrimidine dimer DNA glycosylase/endonuclease V [Endomicrobiaceae bacterium]MDD4165612.1 pyrimidine dimer DNA glycosylase/endonuclease V [Endomicrobiaceae bacterium]